MAQLIASPTVVEAAGVPPKLIEELIGRVNTQTAAVSIAHMRSPSGWAEPGQTPEFDEYTLVLAGRVRVESRDGVLDVEPGQAAFAPRGQWVRYSTPGPEGADYVSVCLPAFGMDIVHRDEE